MATFSLVHGAWGGGWCWDLLRAELEERGHVVRAPDLPCEDVTAGIEEYTAAVPAADVVVGYSLGGVTIPSVEAGTHVFLTALVAGTGWEGVFVSGFGDARQQSAENGQWRDRPWKTTGTIADGGSTRWRGSLRARAWPHGMTSRWSRSVLVRTSTGGCVTCSTRTTAGARTPVSRYPGRGRFRLCQSLRMPL
jgi:Alpha/beta hydrolase family